MSSVTVKSGYMVGFLALAVMSAAGGCSSSPEPINKPSGTAGSGGGSAGSTPTAGTGGALGGTGGATGGVSGGGVGGTTGGGGSTGGFTFGGTGGTPVVTPYCDGKTHEPLPLTVLSGGDKSYVASGYYGTDGAVPADITASDCAGDRADVEVGQCSKFAYSAASDTWAGVAFQYPANNWGTTPGLCIAEGAKKITFWAKGAAGNEKVSFSIFGKDVAGSAAGVVTLTTTWTEYEIDISAVDYNGTNGTHIAFSWVADAAANPSGATFFVDSIQWVGEGGGEGGNGGGPG